MSLSVFTASLAAGLRPRKQLFRNTHLYIRCLTQAAALQSPAFPLDKPSWAVKTLLSKPSSVQHSAELDRDLDQKEIAHLYQLSGLKMADAAKDPSEYASVSKHINQLRDLLSHIRTVTETGDLESVQPLVRIAEPIHFTAQDPAGGLSFDEDSEAHLGKRVLDMASKKSESFLMIED
ncbi:hypothetical protein H4R99_004217 [Coemansia sp. RSA 1722]|nr:hypothetical protein IWW45_005332 [Coemansia sp. RSA 485]KAJ2597785.1 hypothetical protein GGF39_002907 [Coemansia sp. RSA 1721]KAJ2598162.1 hypothetical protein H4R99_004217 [Coemansia sp. RSA 1722]